MLQHITFEINHRTLGGGGGGGVELLIFETTEIFLVYSIQHKNISCLFLSLLTYLSNIMVSSTQTLTQIKSRGFIDHTQSNLSQLVFNIL